MDYWSVEKKASILSSLLQHSNTPVLQLVAPKSHLIETMGDTPKFIEIESYHDKLTSFRLFLFRETFRHFTSTKKA
jgi:hypothetical protein